MPIPSASLYPAALDSDTSLFKLTDRKTFTLAGGITDTALAMTVNESCAGLTGNFFLAFVTGEMIYVTSISSSTMTIIRGASGTSPTTHSTSEASKMIVTAQIFEQFKRVFVAIETELGIVARGAFATVAARIADAESRLTNHTHTGGSQGPLINADTVDTFHATATPTASRIVVSDGSGKVDAWVSGAASGTAGKVALATTAEINASVEASKAVVPSALAASIHATRFLSLVILDPLTALAVANPVAGFNFVVPPDLAGYKLVGAYASVDVASSSGNITIQLRHLAGAFLSTAITILATRTYSTYSGTTQPVVNATYAALASYDTIFADCTAAGTGAKGLQVTLVFRLP